MVVEREVSGADQREVSGADQRGVSGADQRGVSGAIQRDAFCLVIAAPSGAGKTSITRALLAQEPALRLSVSMTTRALRPGEADGVHYHFADQATFDATVAAGGFLEHAGVFARSYGSPRAPVEAWLAEGHDVVFDIDWQGHRQVRAALPGRVVGLFILPPSRAALLARLVARGDPPQAIAGRMAQADSEMSHAGEFDHVVVNDDFEATVAAVRAVVAAQRLARARLAGLDDFLAGLRQP
ncbi:MAG: guanylate kinase [Acetobacteraceae bacterium]|nr:guanylate kinase [Acetobacteraceae bacterium]